MAPTNEPVKHAPHTLYMRQLLESADVPMLHGWAVSFASWLLLAGFVVFPGTFTTIESVQLHNQTLNNAETFIFSKVKNLPLLGVAGVCSGLGAIGMLIFWIRWRHNYIVITEKVFLPGVFQGLAGVLSSVVNVYTAESGNWSITARVTVAVEGGCAVICGLIFAFYWGLLYPTKKQHDDEMKNHEKKLRGELDEEQSAEGKASKARNEEIPTVKSTPSRKTTAMSTSGMTNVDAKSSSELKATNSPVNELAYEEQPDIILTPKRPNMDQAFTGVTEVGGSYQDSSKAL